jgi:hypothetical protein
VRLPIFLQRCLSVVATIVWEEAPNFNLKEENISICEDFNQ